MVRHNFDEDVCNIIQATLLGNIDRRFNTMSKLIVGYASERFGHFEKTDLHSKQAWRKTKDVKARIKIPKKN